MTDTHGIAYLLLTVVGPALLLIAIAWALLHNRASRRRREETERATHRLYQEEDRAHRSGEDKTS